MNRVFTVPAKHRDDGSFDPDRYQRWFLNEDMPALRRIYRKLRESGFDADDTREMMRHMWLAGYYMKYDRDYVRLETKWDTIPGYKDAF